VTAGFGDRLAAAVARRSSQIVLGLDPHPDRVPGGAEGAERFCVRVLGLAGSACVAAKIQLACFERFGAPGWAAFEAVAAAAADADLIVIADAKRGDIGRTSEAYAAGLLRGPVDALTVNPMMGHDALQPFIDAAEAGGRGLFALVRTSNPGAAALQDLPLADGRLWHQALADQVAEWGRPSVGAAGLSALGAVVGATVPAHLADLRARMPQQPLLLPGVGAQGGRPEDLGAAFATARAGGLVAASRGIIFADDPLAAAEDLRARVWAVSEGTEPPPP
jgi:orotidine-5'-phosphate decarboxylase